MNELSKRALSAAMRGGADGWGTHGSSTNNIRYSEPLPKRPGRKKKCHCGCGNEKTHVGMANGVALVSACQLGIARWVKTGLVIPRKLKGSAA